MLKKRICAALTAGVMLLLTACSKEEDNSSSKYEYSSKDFTPFMILIDGYKIDLMESDADINRKLGGNFARDLQASDNVVLLETKTENEDGVTTRTFACNKPEVNGSRFSCFNGLWANVDEASIDSMSDPDSIKVKGADGLSYYWSFYIDGEEIDYSEVNFEGTDTEDTLMQYQLKGKMAEDYCIDKLENGDCRIVTSILFKTAEQKSYSCEITVSTLDQEDK